MSIADTVKDIKPTQWALIAGAGLGLGLLLRMRNKNKPVVAGTTDTPDTLNDTQRYGDYSGTGMTGWNGGAIVNPNAPGGAVNPPVDVTPPPPVPVLVTAPTSPDPFGGFGAPAVWDPVYGVWTTRELAQAGKPPPSIQDPVTGQAGTNAVRDPYGGFMPNQSIVNPAPVVGQTGGF